MSNAYFEDQVFDGVDYREKMLTKGQYDACTFVNCDFSNSDVSEISFSECIFRSCNLSMVKMQKTTLNDARFVHCKMLGIDYEHCNQYLFAVAFENCQLNFSSFYKRGLKKTVFAACTLVEVDFIESDLSGAVFERCDLGGAKFENSNLEKADFRTAHNYILDPSVNKVKKARFSFPGVAGLLIKYDIVIE